MLDIAQQLLAHEASKGESSEIKIPTVVCVSETLRRPISMLAGATGFRALLARSLSLAKAQVPALDGVQVKPDGALDWNEDSLRGLHNAEAEEAGVVLIAQLLGLLSNFIGETLTLRLLHDAWPYLHAIDVNSRGKIT